MIIYVKKLKNKMLELKAAHSTKNGLVVVKNLIVINTDC